MGSRHAVVGRRAIVVAFDMCSSSNPITLYGQQEYVGRALNVACRLQAALKDKGGSPAHNALMSESVYRDYFAQTKPHRVNEVTRNLRNIDDGAQFACPRVWLLRPYEAADEAS